MTGLLGLSIVRMVIVVLAQLPSIAFLVAVSTSIVADPFLLHTCSRSQCCPWPRLPHAKELTIAKEVQHTRDTTIPIECNVAVAVVAKVHLTLVVLSTTPLERQSFVGSAVWSTLEEKISGELTEVISAPDFGSVKCKNQGETVRIEVVTGWLSHCWKFYVIMTIDKTQRCRGLLVGFLCLHSRLSLSRFLLLHR